MEEDSAKKDLVPSSGRALSPISNEKNRLIQQTVSDALDLIPETGPMPQPDLNKVGQWEFREEDYSQLKVWAPIVDFDHPVFGLPGSPYSNDFASQLEGFADYLAERSTEKRSSIQNWLENGRILRVVLSGEGIYPTTEPGPLLLGSLPALQELWCPSLGLNHLDLSGVPELRHLDCAFNSLIELDLTPTLKLKRLDCSDNEMPVIDLSPATELLGLDCNSNILAELDLSRVNKLLELDCSYNPLCELDLTHVPGLVQLQCCGIDEWRPVTNRSFIESQLHEFDLMPVPSLKVLDCDNNHLTKLDLTSVPELTKLRCRRNNLTELDLTPVPELTMLNCMRNKLSELDIRDCPNLAAVFVDPFWKSRNAQNNW